MFLLIFIIRSLMFHCNEILLVDEQACLYGGSSGQACLAWSLTCLAWSLTVRYDRTRVRLQLTRCVRSYRSLTHTNLRFQVYTAVIYFKNNDFILKIIQYNWVYNIVGNLF